MTEHADALRFLEERHLRRHLRPIDRVNGDRLVRGDSTLLSFGSNDYLGIRQHPNLVNAAHEAIDQFGCGAGASRLVTGSLTIHHLLEHRLAEFLGQEAALIFESGYAAATGTIPALVRPGDIILIDKRAHACLIDGARLSRATIRVFPHNHTGKLENLLRLYRGKRVLVISESVFSMDGDLSPLREIVALKDFYGANLLVDEAHAIGVLGPDGRGWAVAEDLHSRVDVNLGTLSKAVGASGGFVAGRADLIERLINTARTLMFSTAPAPASVAAALAGLALINSEEGAVRRNRLFANVSAFCRGLDLPNGSPQATPIIPLAVGQESTAAEVAEQLLAAGYWVPAIRYPAVPKGQARLRLTISATHAASEIASVQKELKRVLGSVRQPGEG